MSVRMWRKDTGGVWIQIMGGTPTVPLDRSQLVLGSYQPGPTNTGLLAGYTWSNTGMSFNGAPIANSVINGDYAPNGTDTLLQNTVINGQFMPGGVRNTIKNCVVRGTPAGAPTGANNNRGLVQVSALAQDARVIDCMLRPQTPGYSWFGCGTHDYTALRCDISRTVDGFAATKANAPTNVNIQGCWVHDLVMVSPDPNHTNDNRTHNDCLQIQGGDGVNVDGNFFDAVVSNFPAGEGWVAATMDVTTNPPNVWAPPHRFSASGRCLATSCIVVTPNSGTPKISANHRIVNNWFFGGAAGGIDYANVSGGLVGSQGDAGVIDGNKFDHWSDGPLPLSGTSPNSYTIRIGEVWTANNIGTNNVYYDTLAPVVVRTGLVGN